MTNEKTGAKGINRPMKEAQMSSQLEAAQARREREEPLFDQPELDSVESENCSACGELHEECGCEVKPVTRGRRPSVPDGYVEPRKSKQEL